GRSNPPPGPAFARPGQRSRPTLRRPGHRRDATPDGTPDAAMRAPDKPDRDGHAPLDPAFCGSGRARVGVDHRRPPPPRPRSLPPAVARTLVPADDSPRKYAPRAHPARKQPTTRVVSRASLARPAGETPT